MMNLEENTKVRLNNMFFSYFDTASGNYYYPNLSLINKPVMMQRLITDKTDWAKNWLLLNCSEKYFNDIYPIFHELKQVKGKDKLWSNIENKYDRFYTPFLESFKKEFLELYKKHPVLVSSNFLKYFILNRNFYKAKQSIKNVVEINSNFRIPKLKLPTRLVELEFNPNSRKILNLIFDEPWQFSLYIQNDKNTVESFLKLNITLVGQPLTFYSNYFYGIDSFKN